MATHNYSNIMIVIPGWHKHAMLRMGRNIPDRHLGADGREAEPHITVKYGIAENVPPEKLRRALAGFGPVTVRLGKTSLFRNDDADVVKIDIDSADLHRLSALIGKIIATPGNTHPDYRPHATIAYVKPGFGVAHDGDHTLSGQVLMSDTLVFSGKDGRRHPIPLTRGTKK